MRTSLFVFAHGWGYDSHFWEPLLDHLKLLSSQILLLEEGYYHQECPAPLSLPQEPYWAIGHSAGVMRLLGQNLHHCQGLIAFNGFACFAQREDFPHGVAPRILERMHRMIAKQPHHIIENFRLLCGDHTSLIPDYKNISKLQHGLKMLLKEDYRPRLQELHFPLYDITSPNDPLEPARLGLASSAKNAYLLPFKSAEEADKMGHLLPLTHPQECAKFMKNILEKSQHAHKL